MSCDLVTRIRAGERAAVATALNLLDARERGARERALPLLEALTTPGEADDDNGIRVGLTGAPGAGKSTLLDALIAALRARGSRVGVVAVDPSSQQSGGALLADRVRARRASGDEQGVFRSMAARGRLGGVAAATRAAVDVLAVAYDWVIVETVGVGQSEIEVADLVDTLVYVAQPEAGDILQAMKAGVLELPHVFVVNKADLGLPAERTAQELRRGLALGTAAADAWQPPVLLVAASEDRGIEALVDAIVAHRASSDAPTRAARRRAGSARFVATELATRYGSYGLAAIGGTAALDAALTAAPARHPLAQVARIGARIEQALRNGS
ncbi:MAG: GTP-binding protein [Gammaproteobacteria bacterium]